ncbi:group III truncated hemoglobin [Helicobacter sp. MIT 99-5507]|uniref:group III truncated hemoglobin n=1 Tax=Helicobacter sp. MIT 99-5507 TaxID=152489 RepID=UPI000E1E2EE5|nr:group III truncated hemoglobin [Helicobacter sp. MIT 99-5507]RDU58463.1 hypothetical protein CQA42_01345 [Helicobacter sp. MIT 99-5507]
MIYSDINKESIDKLMDIFYDKIKSDNNLGPIFKSKIGESKEAWDKHKDKISNFWQGQILGEGNYRRQPMKTHIELPPFPQEFFNIWLDLFSQSLDLVFDDNCKAVFLKRAQMIANSFQNMIYKYH